MTDEHKLWVLQRALYGSHLHPSLNSFDQHTITNVSSSSSSTPTEAATFKTLNTILLLVDSKKQPHERKSADTQLRLGNHAAHDKCPMCVMAKQVLQIHDISYHNDNTPCPQKNIDAMSKLLKSPKLVKDIDFTKTSQGKFMAVLPTGFDTTQHCGNCFLSSQSNGKDSIIRGQIYRDHPSKNCSHVLAKRTLSGNSGAYHPHNSHHASSSRSSYGDQCGDRST